MWSARTHIFWHTICKKCDFALFGIRSENAALFFPIGNAYAWQEGVSSVIDIAIRDTLVCEDSYYKCKAHV